MRVSKYVIAWCMINFPLCFLWGYLMVDPGISFMLGMAHGQISATGLLAVWSYFDE